MNRQITQDTCDRVADFLNLFCAFAQRLRLYGASHPRTRETRTDFKRLMLELAEKLALDELVISYHNQRFYLEHVPLTKANAHTALLREAIERRGMGGFLLSLRVTRELDRVLKIVANEKPAPDEAMPRGFQWLTREEREKAARTIQDNVLLNLKNSRVNVELYDEALSVVSTFFDDCEKCKVGDLAPVADMAERLAEEVLERPQEILPRTTIPYYAEFAAFRAVNACLVSLRTAELVVTSRHMLNQVAIAALIHDVGEILVPREVRYKGDALTPLEARLIMKHPLKGVEIVQGIPGLHPVVLCAIFGHHIKPDGTGYPEACKEYKPGPVTLLIEIVDIFEALTSFRPHKRAITAPAAFVHLYTDPGLATLRPYTDLLAQAIGFHPLGVRVRLPSGECAVVCDHENSDPLRPVVRLLTMGADGQASLGTETVAVPGDIPWYQPPSDAPAVIHALDPLEDLDLMSGLSPQGFRAIAQPTAEASG